MAVRGGYQVIDLKNKALSGTEVTIPGIYALIEGTRKPILLHNIVIGATEYHDAFVTVTVSSSDFVTTVYGKVITITDDDEVTAADPT